MGPKLGEVYELDASPEADVGPWIARKGPGVVLAVVGDIVQLCPLTSAEQKGVVRVQSVQFTEPIDGLNVPIWAAVPYTHPIALTRFERLRPRAQLKPEHLRPIRLRLSAIYGLPPPASPAPKP